MKLNIFKKRKEKIQEESICYLPVECQIYFYVWKHLRKENQFLLVNTKYPYNITIINI